MFIKIINKISQQKMSFLIENAFAIDIATGLLQNAQNSENPEEHISAILKEFGENPDFLKLILREIVSSFRLKLAISILENAENVSALLAVFGQNLKFLKRILEEKISNDLRLKIAKWVVEKIIPAPVEEEPAEEEPAKEEPVEKIIPPSEEESDEEESDEEEPVEEEPAKEEPAEEEPVEKESYNDGFTTVSYKSTRWNAQAPWSKAQAQQSYRTPHNSNCLKCGVVPVQFYNGEPNPYCSGCYNKLKPDCKRNGCKNKCNSYTDSDGYLWYNDTCKECWENRPQCKQNGCETQVAFDSYNRKFNPLCGWCHSTKKY